jgi:PAS domain S-box-containing protein
VPETRTPLVTNKSALLLTGGLIVLIGIIVFLGWVTEHRLMISLLPGGTLTVMNSAVCQILCGIGLIALSRGYGRFARVLGVALIALCVLIVFEEVAGINLGLRNLFWTHAYASAPWPPGKMAPLAAGAFALCGLVLILGSGSRKRFNWLAGIAGLLMALSLLPLLQYLSLHFLADGGQKYANMAIPSALCLLLMALAIIRGLATFRAEQVASMFSVAALGLLFSVVRLTMIGNAELIVVNAQVSHSSASREIINHVVSEVARMESSARGYVLTGKASFADRVFDHLALVRQQLDELEPVLGQERVQVERLAALRRLAEEKFTHTATLVRMREQQGFEPAREYLGQLDTTITSALVRLADLMLATEQADLEQSLAVQQSLESNIRIILTLGGLLTFGLLVGAVFFTRHAIRARREAENQVNAINELQRGVLDGTDFSIIATETDGLIREFNAGAEKLLGYARDEMVGKQTPEIIHLRSEMVARAAELSAQNGRDIQPGFEVFVDAARQSRVEEREWTYVRKDGTHVPVLLSVTALHGKTGEVTGYLGVAQNLTERKAMVAALEATEQRLRQVVQDASCLVWEANVELSANGWHWRTSVYPSAFGQRLFSEYEPQKWGLLWDQAGAVAEKRALDECCRNALESGARGYSQEFHYKGNGQDLWLRESVAIQQLSPGKYFLVGVAIDITANKQAELELAQSHSLVLAAFESTADGILVVSAQGVIKNFNQRFVDIWRLGEVLKKTRDDGTVLQAVLDQLTEPEQFMAKVRELYQQPEAESFDTLRFKDGRIVERYSRAQWLEKQVVGRVWSFRDVTELRQTEMELRTRETRLSDIFRAMAEGMVLQNAEGRIVECNQAALSILGLTRDQLMGVTSLDPAWRTVRPDGSSFPGQDHPVMETLRTGNACRGVEMGVHKPDGSLVWIAINTEPLFDGQGRVSNVIGTFADISARRAMENALRESEERTRIFAEHAPAAVAMFDREMRYLVHSAKWLKDYRLENRDIIGRSHYEVFPEIGEAWKEIHRRCLAGATEINEAAPFDRADGTRQWLSWRVQPWLNAAGAIGGIVMFTEDITRRKQLEESLAAARDEALTASKLKSEFLANVSHEIRTPMNGVLGMADLLMDTSLTADQRQMGRVIQASAQNLLTIIDDLLDFSKVEAGKFRLSSEEFNLAEQVDQAMALMVPRAVTGNISLQSDLPPDLPTRLTGDPGRIQQVLVNLLGNAVKFTEKGSVSVAVRPQPSVRPGRYAFRVEVRDSGIGITEEQKTRLFQPFMQADGSTTRRFGGTGLGLAISRQLIELMGGCIGCESEPGRGSTFWFELELAVPASTEPIPPDSRPKEEPLSSGRILVAEDQHANRLVMQLMLNKLGLAHTLVEDGQAVIEELSRGAYSAVLMDCQMPRIDGYEATRLIRAGAAGPENQAIPIVALTANAMSSDREKCFEAGMDEYLSKPVRTEALIAILAKLGVSLDAMPAKSGAVAADATELARAPVLDAGQLAQLRGLPGRTQATLLEELIGMALREIPPALKQLREQLTQGSEEIAAGTAHRLAGSAANLGARRLRELLQSLEAQIGERDHAAVLKRMPDLDREWELVQNALRSHLPKPAHENSDR